MASDKLRIFVGRLPWTVSSDVLKAYCSRFGQVISATVKFNKESGLSRGYGFVQFSNQESYKSALCQQSHKIDGSNVVVQRALYDDDQKISYDIE